MQTSADTQKVDSKRTENPMCCDRQNFMMSCLGHFMSVGLLLFSCFDKVNSFYCRWNLSWGGQFRRTGQIQNAQTQRETAQICTRCTIYSSILFFYFTIESFSETDVVSSSVQSLRMSMVTLILKFKRKPNLSIEPGLWTVFACNLNYALLPHSFVVFEI